MRTTHMRPGVFEKHTVGTVLEKKKKVYSWVTTGIRD